MAWRVSWQVKCERCKELGPRAHDSHQAESKAIKKGWLVGNSWGMALHLCPACVALGLPEWWPDATGKDFHWEHQTA